MAMSCKSMSIPAPPLACPPSSPAPHPHHPPFAVRRSPHTYHAPLCFFTCAPRRSIADDEDSVLSGRHGLGGGRISLKLPGGTTGGSRGGVGATGGSYQHMWPRDYIQDLQQNLALRCGVGVSVFLLTCVWACVRACVLLFLMFLTLAVFANLAPVVAQSLRMRVECKKEGYASP